MNAYQVLVDCEGRLLDVFVAAKTKAAAEALAWGHDDHFRVVGGAATVKVEPPDDSPLLAGVQAVLPIKTA